MNKKENGITLIALVITIIVLLILAGVSISLVAGDNGILSKTTDASEKTEIASVEEDVELAWSAVTTAFYEEKYVNNYNSSKEAYFADESKLNAQLQSGQITNYTVNKEDSEDSDDSKIISYTLEYKVKKNSNVYTVTVDTTGKASAVLKQE